MWNSYKMDSLSTVSYLLAKSRPTSELIIFFAFQIRYSNRWNFVRWRFTFASKYENQYAAWSITSTSYAIVFQCFTNGNNIRARFYSQRHKTTQQSTSTVSHTTNGKQTGVNIALENANCQIAEEPPRYRAQ